MKRILIGLFCISGLSFAQYESLNTIDSMDRLEQLSRTLGQGSYSHPENMDIEGSSDGSAIYVYKDESGASLLSHKKITTEGYKQESVTYYPSTNSMRDNWNIFKCEKDRFNSTKHCVMYKKNLMIGIYQGAVSVFVGTGHFPRRQSAIKIDNNKAIYGVEGNINNPQTVINQMIKGKIVYIRYVEWPYDFNKDEEISLDGFVDAYNELKRKYKEL